MWYAVTVDFLSAYQMSYLSKIEIFNKYFDIDIMFFVCVPRDILYWNNIINTNLNVDNSV